MIGVNSNHYYPENETEGKILYYLCYHSARLRNTAVYNGRQYFFDNDEAYIGDAKLHADTRKNENYGYMICDMADQAINHVKRDFHSYYGARKSPAVDDNDIVQLEVKPRFGGKFYDITAVYRTEKEECRKQKKARRIMAGDVGVITFSRSLHILTMMHSS